MKVLDPPDVPEKKSFPPRFLIVLAGIVLGGIFGVAWIRGSENWKRLDPQDARKLFAHEILGGVRHTLSRSRNGFEGSGVNGAASEQTPRQGDKGAEKDEHD